VYVITTAGFRDTLEIARTNRTVLYDIKTLKPAPIVAREDVFEVDERLLADGSVLRPLDPAQVRAIAAQLHKDAVKGAAPGALIVCFLHSYANPAHEEQAVAILRESLPDWFICNSADVLPEMREYERFNTAALNAYIGPLMARYLRSLATTLRDAGYRGAGVQIMTSSGGIVADTRAARYPVHTVLSGPAGGVAAAIHLGREIGARNLITYDMGGTSTDVCLIEALSVPMTSEQFIAGLPVRTPQIEINSVGAGGGSIAWIDAGRMLKVGPRSAGAAPGPACYGKGGEEPTVTDANLVIGRLAASIKLGGVVELNEALAHTAVERIARAFESLDVPRAAEGIVRIAVARMVSAIKEISIARGFDPRDFALMAFGGAGPMHAAFIADDLEISHVIVPLRPGNFCAFGALISDVRHDHLRTFRTALANASVVQIERSFAEVERIARRQMMADMESAATVAAAPATSAPTSAGVAKVAQGDGGHRIRLLRFAGMRYVGQSWDLSVPVPDPLESMDALADAFHAVHERRFGYRSNDPVEIVSLRVAAIEQVAKPSLRAWQGGSSLAQARRGARQVVFDGRADTASVFERDVLPVGAKLDGPAIVEEMGAVTIVPPLWRLELGTLGELHLRKDGK
jgi:N-methylhydantoinase A